MYAIRSYYELEREQALATGQRFQGRLVVAELGEWYLRRDAHATASRRVAARNASADASEVARNVSDGITRCRYLDLGDRLEHDRLGFGDCVDEGALASRDECDLFGVDGMVLAVVDRDTHVTERIAGDRPLVELV